MELDAAKSLLMLASEGIDAFCPLHGWIRNDQLTLPKGVIDIKPIEPILDTDEISITDVSISKRIKQESIDEILADDNLNQQVSKYEAYLTTNDTEEFPELLDLFTHPWRYKL